MNPRGATPADSRANGVKRSALTPPWNRNRALMSGCVTKPHQTGGAVRCCAAPVRSWGSMEVEYGVLQDDASLESRAGVLGVDHRLAYRQGRPHSDRHQLARQRGELRHGRGNLGHHAVVSRALHDDWPIRWCCPRSSPPPSALAAGMMVRRTDAGSLESLGAP